ncbi:putative Protein transport protein Sec61 subunit gamma [Hypsibius exemplaris]|uniref:Protein transport protein Sec61 subunit gamma n=1 Tax=Hypsibius exemplaris TaxID=2072580 RepID=A0A9X6RMY1_HYPEX|nr:putative Protein transport protein Sec61 subunit gamma [Hypsibius exemplaris]
MEVDIHALPPKIYIEMEFQRGHTLETTLFLGGNFLGNIFSLSFPPPNGFSIPWLTNSEFKRRDKMDQVNQFVDPLRLFAKDSIRLVKRCTKPDRKEYQKIAVATAIGFAIMGFIGFFVKLIHIPINNIIVGS